MAKKSKSSKRDKEESSILVQLQAVARQSRTHMARHLLDSGLYAGQEQIVKLIAQHGSLSSGEIARSLGVRPPTVTKSIARLQEQGFVERTRGDDDGRIVRVSLTKAGLKTLKKADKAARKTEKQSLRKLSTKQQRQLSKALEKIAENLEIQEKRAQKKAG